MVPVDDGTIASAQQGDARALERVLEALAPSIDRFARRMCGHDADADDVVQDALLAIAQKLPTFERRASLSSWAFAVTRSACSHRRRGAKNRPTQSLDEADDAADSAFDPESSASRAELRDAIERALASLDDDHREVLLLRDAEGLTAPEAAAALGIGVDALKSRLHRARRALHAALAPAISPARRDAAATASRCPDVIEAWSQETEGDLRAEDCKRLQGHVAACARCGTICESLRRELGACAALREGPVGVGIRERVSASIAEWRRLRAKSS